MEYNELYQDIKSLKQENEPQPREFSQVDSEKNIEQHTATTTSSPPTITTSTSPPTSSSEPLDTSLKLMSDSLTPAPPPPPVENNDVKLGGESMDVA